MTDKKKIIIAIDGFSSTGKSTVAKKLAKRLGYVYVDTGAMYRAITLFAMEKGYVSETNMDKEAIIASLPGIRLEFKPKKSVNGSHIYLNGQDVEEEIRKLPVSNLVSRVAAVSEVRRKLVIQQKEMGEKKGLVMDGRDIGTVVFPEAELKIFLTASVEVRAQRRYLELLEKGENVSYEKVAENIANRDRIDTTRADSPLKKAEDAIEVDTSDLSPEEQFHFLLNLAEQRISGNF